MPASGSILGNAVRRLEDPTLLTGAGKYVDDLVETGTLHVAFVRSTVAHGDAGRGRRRRRAVDAGRGGRVPRGGDDLGLPSLQQFAMMPRDAEPAHLRDGQGAVRRRHRRRRRGRDARAGGRRGRAWSWSSTTRCRRSSARSTRWRPTRRCCSPSTVRTSASAPTFPEEGDVDPLDGADAVAEVTMVSQRLAGVPMETNGILAVPTDGLLTCWVSHQAPHAIHAAYAPMLGLEPAQLRVVCPWVGGGFGPKAAPYVEHLVAAAAALKLGSAGEVDRDAVGGHGVAGARPRLRDDGQARRAKPTARSSVSTPPWWRRPAPTRASARSCRCSRR